MQNNILKYKTVNIVIALVMAMFFYMVILMFL
jgi:hypothetical protein